MIMLLIFENLGANMRLKPKTLTLLMVAISYSMANAYANQISPVATETQTVNQAQVHDLGEINISVESTQNQTNLLGSRANVTDQTVKSDELKQRPTTLGDALSGELGIHSNQFGGGASAPIIRGQEGKRITILQNNADVIDMAHLSPDHAVMVDTVLAKQAEVVRGASTLLYKSGNSAGVVNVIDNKIPSQMPEKAVTGEAGFRFNTGNNEKLTTGALTVGLGSNIAVHLEGLHKDAGNYRTPNYRIHQFKDLQTLENFIKAQDPTRLAALEKEYQAIKNGESLSWRDKVFFISSEEDYLREKAKLAEHIAAVPLNAYAALPESWAKSTAGSLGVSWIGENGYIGVAASERKDRYGLPAHNHIYDGCEVISVFDSLFERPYLAKYPQLIDESDVNYINPRPNCVGQHVHNNSHSHGIQQKHEYLGVPYIDLTTRRYDLRTEWQNPIQGVEKVRANIGYVDYQHDEKEADITTTSFNNTGKVARVEFTHAPSDRLKALWGVQYTEQDNSALSPQTQWRQQQLLTKNTLKNGALFAMGQYQLGNVELELAGRLEKQKVALDYDLDYIENIMRERSFVRRNPEKLAAAIDYAKNATRPYRETAGSYALGVHWNFLPDYTLSFNASHQQRLPNSQELYTHGMHLATNSFEIGNRHLNKEKSNNYELALAFKGDKLDYKLAGYLYDFDNYIYLSTINEHLGTAKVEHFRQLRINRYDQSPARFYGFEGKIGYQINPTYYVSLFGDYVKGRLHDMPQIVTAYNFWTGEKTYSPQADTYTPRLPPMRLGAKINADFDEHWSGNVEFVRTFKQDKVSKFESPTAGHNLLNLGLTYQNVKGDANYSLFLNANNLLDQKVYAHETHLPYIPQIGRNFNLGVNVKY